MSEIHLTCSVVQVTSSSQSKVIQEDKEIFKSGAGGKPGNVDTFGMDGHYAECYPG